jgi:hypothetical protein
MPQWVRAIVSLIERMIIWFSHHLFQPSMRETNELIQQPGEVEQVGKKGKRQRNRDKKRSRQSQSNIKELEQQPAEMKLDQQEELVPQQEAKEEPMEKDIRSDLEEQIKENGRLQETNAALTDQIAHQSKDYEERIAHQSKVHEEQLAHQSKDYEERIAHQSKDYQERIARQSKDYQERIARQSKVHEERIAHQSKDYEERIAHQSKVHEEQLANQSKIHKEHIAKVHEEQIAHRLKVEQDLRAKQLQPVGEDQTGVSAIYASEGGQPRLQSGTLGMEKEVPSYESKATASEMQAAQGRKKGKRRRKGDKKKCTLGMAKEVPSSESTTSEKLVEARLKLNNSEDDNKFVEEGLKKDHQPFSRKNSLTSEASVLPAIDTAVPSQRGFIFRQISSDYKDRLSVIEKAINPELRKCISEKDIAYSTLARFVMCLKLEKPQHSDLTNREWLQKHHFPKSENGSALQQFYKENIKSDEEADKWLEIMEEAAMEGKGKLGRQYFRFLKKIAELNHKVHPKVDLEEVITDGCTWDGEDFRELLEFLKGKEN